MTAVRDRAAEAVQGSRAADLLSRRLVPLVVAAYLGCRFFTYVVMSLVAAHQDPGGIPRGPQGGEPGYLDLTRMWDGDWYHSIVDRGYPSVLPRGDQGELQQNAWAFYPLFPMLVRLLMSLTGQSYALVASTTALVAGAAAAGVMAVLLRDRVGPFVAFCAVLVYAASPPSPTLQLAYTESLAMLLLVAFLLAVSRERWEVAAGLALLTGLTRPIALPLGLVALVAVIVRWRAREQRPISPRTYAGMAGSLLACGVSGLIWPMIASWRTGVPTAYTDTMATWRSAGEIRPFAPWFINAGSQWGEVLGPVLVVLAGVALVITMGGPWARGLGPELRAWTLGYVLYLFAVLDPWTSLYRYLLFAFPLAVVLIGGGWATGDPRGRTRFVGLRTAVFVVLGLGWQVWWVWELLRIVPPMDNPI